MECDIVELSDNAVVTADAEQLQLNAVNITLNTGSVLWGKEMNVSVSDTFSILSGSILTTASNGYDIGEGIAPGQALSTGGSGGSHGGRGGPGRVDAVGHAYGAVKFPVLKGSGAGTGYYGSNSTGSSGGDVICL
jgi:hypothetical protein